MKRNFRIQIIVIFVELISLQCRQVSFKFGTIEIFWNICLNFLKIYYIFVN